MEKKVINYRNDVEKYIELKYEVSPEYLWKKFPSFAIFRHKLNRKWFALFACVEYEKVGVKKLGKVDILNVKLDDYLLVDALIHQNGFAPAYHMQKERWITVLLDGSVPLDKIENFIDISYENTTK